MPPLTPTALRTRIALWAAAGALLFILERLIPNPVPWVRLGLANIVTLLALVEHTFGVPASHVVGEYGMTELASQYYTTSLRAVLVGTPLDDVWSHPAWLRPRIVDAETGAALDPATARETGLLAHHDLASRGSVAHVLTADLAQPARGSFVLAGRSRDAGWRGCGLAYESSGAP